MKRNAAILALVPAALIAACEERSTPPSTTTNPPVSAPPTRQTMPTPETAPRPVTPPPVSKPAPDMPPAPDNTGRNERDRDGGTVTPPNQSESAADVKITADVRSAITSDSAMSVNARNVKIITQNGVVTLRGPVETQAEKDAIDAKAKAVAGVSRVDNQLEVKPGNP